MEVTPRGGNGSGMRVPNTVVGGVKVNCNWTGGGQGAPNVQMVVQDLTRQDGNAKDNSKDKMSREFATGTVTVRPFPSRSAAVPGRASHDHINLLNTSKMLMCQHARCTSTDEQHAP